MPDDLEFDLPDPALLSAKQDQRLSADGREDLPDLVGREDGILKRDQVVNIRLQAE